MSRAKLKGGSRFSGKKYEKVQKSEKIYDVVRMLESAGRPAWSQVTVRKINAHV